MVTIVLPISRKDYLRPVFNCLAELEKSDDTELLIITDGDESLTRAVDNRLDSISFKRIRVINFGDKPGEDINSRRFRIAAIHNKAKNYIDDSCELVFLVEDDTTYPPFALTYLINYGRDQLPGVGYIGSLQLGRHNTPYVGQWICDDTNDPTRVTSVLPKKVDRLPYPVDAGGFYCCLVRADLYRKHTFEPFDKQGKNGLGCDVNFGIWLKRQGYSCWYCQAVMCDHIGEKGSVNLGNTKPVQVVFEKTGNRWMGRTEV